METNIHNRNFTISTKVSAYQKALFIQEAKKHNISLSEYVCSRLDLSIDTYGDVKPLEQIRQLKGECKTKDEKITKLSSSLETANLFIEINKLRKLSQAETILELKNANLLLTENIISKSPMETVNNENKMAINNENLNFISGIAFFLSLIVIGSK